MQMLRTIDESTLWTQRQNNKIATNWSRGFLILVLVDKDGHNDVPFIMFPAAASQNTFVHISLHIVGSMGSNNSQTINPSVPTVGTHHQRESDVKSTKQGKTRVERSYTLSLRWREVKR